MARSKSKSTATLKIGEPSQAEPVEFILADFRISKLHAERFLSPEQARIGTFTVSSETDKVIFHDKKESSKQTGLLTFSLELCGNAKTDTEALPDGKSFSVKIEAEGRFEVHGQLDVKDQEKCVPLLEPIITLLYGLCVHHVRAEADSMGYRTVRPAYQAPNRPVAVLEKVGS